MDDDSSAPNSAVPESARLGVEDIRAARTSIGDSVLPTPLTHSPRLSRHFGREIYLKWESRHPTGSFKERGAAHVLARLEAGERERGVCAASAGNHALALSFHAARHGVPCTIVMPRSAPLVKVRSTEKTGANVILEGATFAEAVEYAKAYASDQQLTYVSPYDNLMIIAGQGTCGLELVEQLDHFDAVVVPYGGGGLLAGIATVLKELRPQTRVFGVRSAWASDGHATGAPKHTALRPLSIADGIAVKQIGELTKPIIERAVEAVSTVEESEIASAVIQLLEEERSLVEGAGAVGIAALALGTIPAECARVVVIISGSNIDLNLLSRLIDREMAERSQLLRVLVSVPDRPGALFAVTGLVAESRANVLQVFHDRSYTAIPGNVDIEFLLEVRDEAHGRAVIDGLSLHGLAPRFA